MNVIGKKVGKYTIEDKLWFSEKSIVIFTNSVQLPNEENDFCLKVIYREGVIIFYVGYNDDDGFVLIDENLNKYVTSEEKEEFIKIFKEIWKNEHEDEEEFIKKFEEIWEDEDEY